MKPLLASLLNFIKTVLGFAAVALIIVWLAILVVLALGMILLLLPVLSLGLLMSAIGFAADKLKGKDQIKSVKERVLDIRAKMFDELKDQ